MSFSSSITTQFCFNYTLDGVTAMPRGLHARLCHAFLVIIIIIIIIIFIITHLLSDSIVCSFITLVASSGKHSVTVWRPSVCLSVCPVDILTVTLQRAASDAARVHFAPTQ